MDVRTLTDSDIDALLPSLTTLLVANVADGASIGFHPPLARSDAERYWRGVRAGVRQGERLMLGAFDASGALVGSAQLALEHRPNGRHRAEVQKVIVSPGVRRRGVGRQLMQALEDAARAAGRRLLVLDTREGDAAERMYRALGWEFVGRVPGYVLEHDGTTHATLIFYRALPAP